MYQYQGAQKMAADNANSSTQRVDQPLLQSTNMSHISEHLQTLSKEQEVNETNPFLTSSTSKSSSGYLPSYSAIAPPDGPFPVCTYAFSSRPSARSRSYPRPHSITQEERENFKSAKMIRTISNVERKNLVSNKVRKTLGVVNGEYEEEDSTIRAERQNLESMKARRTLGLESPKLSEQTNGNKNVSFITPNLSARQASALLNSKRHRRDIGNDITITIPPRYLRTTSMSRTQMRYQPLSRSENEAENGVSPSCLDDISPRSSPRLFKRYGSHCLFSCTFLCSCLVLMVLWFTVIGAACVGFAWVLLWIQGRV